MEAVHPLIEFSRRTGKSLTSIAKEAQCSRMQLYRVMNGENTTTDLLRRLSAATNNEVPVAVFLEGAD